MCGITALSRAPRSSIPNGLRLAIGSTLAIESRGRHATGYGWADDDGWPWYWKQAGPATKVARNAPLPSTGLRLMIGHTRHYTLGSPAVEANNHPVIHDGITLVHNGRVDNHRELIELTGVERPAEVDSIALPVIIAELDAHPADVLGLVEGVASMAWLDGRDPGALHLARLSVRPLTVGWTRRGDLIMSSTRASLAMTARLAGVSVHDVEELPEGTYLRVESGAVTERRSIELPEPMVRYADDAPVLAGANGGIDWDSLVPRRGWS
jgi:glucosamine--fructose-6-phosphate aminotransferase (isomerizing)